MDTEIAFKYLLELDKIFEEKKWKEKENYEVVLNSLGSFANNIIENDEEYELILELLRQFQWVSLKDYYEGFTKLLTEFVGELGARNQNIYAFPIIKKKHELKVKSGSFISYLIKSLLPYIPKSEKLRFEDINTFSDLADLRFKKSDIFILVDDFIGSGETLNECINEINQINQNLIENVKILTLAIKKDSLQRLTTKYKVYYNFEILRGITDYNTGENVQNKKEIMKRIEKRIFLGMDEYSLGFQQSESLLALLRTPDNTFPIFWSKYKSRIKLTPPFPRYEKAK